MSENATTEDLRVYDNDSVRQEISDVYSLLGLCGDFDSPPPDFLSNTDQFSYTYYWFK
jgi:hypothetical protein